ncbi:hypothetical protein [Bacterioplanoides sp.]|uniref:hypothetical protein n=1 Tax=Bacterioplanoides sp. TaxID=2066072 RepID=UPI003B00835D
MLRMTVLSVLVLLCACNFVPTLSEASASEHSTHLPVKVHSLPVSGAGWLITGASASISQSLQKAYAPELVFQSKHPITEEFLADIQSLQLTITRNRSLFGNVADADWLFCGQSITPDYQNLSRKWSKGQQLITLNFELKNHDRSVADCTQKLLSLKLYLYPADRPVKAELSDPVITIGWIEKE